MRCHRFVSRSRRPFAIGSSLAVGPDMRADVPIKTSKPLGRLCAALAVVLASGLADSRANATAAAAQDSGRFVWRDLMTRDVAGASRFYGELFGWRFENTKRGERPYVVARSGATPVAGLVDVSAIAGAGPQWLSFMAVADVDKALVLARADGGTVLVEPRDLPLARAAVITDPDGAPLGLAQLRHAVPDPEQPTARQFFWQEYLARDAARGLAFYKRLAGYDSTVSDTRLGRGVLRPAKHSRAGRPVSAAASNGHSVELATLRTHRRSVRARRTRDWPWWSHPGTGRARAPKRIARRHCRSRRRPARLAEVSVLRPMINRRMPVVRVVALAVLIVTALASSSCDSGGGIGVSAGTPARWGGTSGAGPPIFVGGPSRD